MNYDWMYVDLNDITLGSTENLSCNLCVRIRIVTQGARRKKVLHFLSLTGLIHGVRFLVVVEIYRNLYNFYLTTLMGE